MKYLNYVILVAFLLAGGNLLAQKEVGYVKYTITDIQSDNEQIMQQAAMLKNGYMEQYTKGDKALTVTNTGGMAITKNVYDKKSGTGTMYMDVMGQKMKVEMTADDRQSMQDGDTEVSVEQIKDETKNILGYKTFKTLVKVKTDDGNTTIEMWVTNDLKSNAGDFSNMLQVGDDDFEIEGVPLEFTVDANGMMSMTYTAKEVKTADEVDSGVFDIDESGYKEMDFDQFKSQMGGF